MSPWDSALEKPVQSFLISVTPGTPDYISLYLHNWAVLRLSIVFTIGESPRVCSKYSHWYYLLLIWGGAKVSSIAISSWSNYFCMTDNANFADGFWFDRDWSRSNHFAHDGQRALIHKIIQRFKAPFNIVFQSDQDDCWMIMNHSVQRCAVYVRDLNIARASN